MSKFKRIGIIGRYRSNHIIDTVQALVDFLQQKQLTVAIEAETAQQILTDKLPIFDKEELAKHCDLVIVVGGDGSLLGAAKIACNHNVPVLGINRGTLGFLTDISPDNFEQKISDVLNGHYEEEIRFLLDVTISNQQEVIAQSTALNDVVLMPGILPHMIAFETYINGKFMCSQRGDGLIVATPTGSTAYALSAGGPILHPSLDALVLVPMFPHKLSSRPIVVKGDSEITVIVTPETESAPRISCDGLKSITLPLGGKLTITKKPQQLRLLHPLDHDYFDTLRNKLGWESR